MTFQDLQTLVDYHYWARDRMLSALEPLSSEQFTRDLGSSFKSVRDTVVHILGAEVAWYLRWQGQSPSARPSPDQFPDVATLRQAWSENERKMRVFLERLGEEGVNRVFEYRLGSQAAASPFWQMLHHVVNHASYHRGQVTTMLRQLGASPPQSLDAIAFYRQVRT